MRKLNTTNLEFAVWIARMGSFTAAAERMHTTQPAVSARVKELEDTLGQKLFVRQGRGVELTPEGREFIDKAEGILKQLDELSTSFSRASLAGVIRLGVSSICLDLLAAISVETSRSMPLVSYQVVIDRAAPLLSLMEARKIDAAIVSGPIDAHKFQSRSLGFDRMMWVTSADLLQERNRLPPSMRLRDLPVWCVQADSFYWGAATAGLRAQGIDLKRVNAIGNTLGVARMVIAGSGIGLVSQRLVQRELEAGTLVPVPDLAAGELVEFSIVWREDAASLIVDEVVAAADANSLFERK